MAMDTMWEKIKKGLKDGAAMSMDKIEEYTKIGKLKIEEMAANRKIDRNYMDIGERVFNLVEEGKSGEVGDDLTVKSAIENIKSLKDELNDIAEKIQEVSEEAEEEKGCGENEEVTNV
ncbi:MAG: hypothetical protein GF401_14615 [Chitinivibrionales bacterium]|nr:hypothetical protein [Chitinivibrionales bacterium]